MKLFNKILSQAEINELRNWFNQSLNKKYDLFKSQSELLNSRIDLSNKDECFAIVDRLVKNNFPIVCIVFCWEFVFLVCLQYFQFGVSEVCTKWGTSKVHQTNILRKLRLRNSEKVVIVVTLKFPQIFYFQYISPPIKISTNV